MIVNSCRFLPAVLLVFTAACGDSGSTSPARSDAPVTAPTEPPAETPTDTPAADVTVATPDDTSPTPLETAGTPILPAEGSNTIVTIPIPAQALYEAGDIDAGLAPFIDQAKDDLAALLGVDASEVTTHAAVLVIWPDASLGCPQPDMRYAQVLTDGSVIELEYDGLVYRYHTGGQRGPFQCETPLTKAPSGEGITLDGGQDY